VRRLLKFLHTIGAIGLMGAMATLIMLAIVAPPAAQLPAYAAVRGAMSAIATWLLLPSLGVTLVAGLVAMAMGRAFHNAGWAWVKLLSGVLVSAGSLQGIIGPLRQEAERSAAALAGNGAAAGLAGTLGPERNTLIVLILVATLNVALGVWRPRLTSIPD
jgi:hypothetical protein